MKRQHFSECSLLQKTTQLSKLCKNEERLTKISQKFASINKNLLQKTEVQLTLANQQTNAVSKLANIEQRIQLSMRKSQEKIMSWKEKLKSTRQNQAKIETSFQQKMKSIGQKLKMIKIRFNSILFEEHYKHQQILSQVQQEFQKVLTKTYQNKCLFNEKSVQKNAIKIHERLNKELNQLRSQSQILQQQGDKNRESLIVQLESKLVQLKERLNQTQSVHQQTIKDVKYKIETMKQEFQAELSEEKAMREQNKEKLITLLQTNLANNLDKTMK